MRTIVAPLAPVEPATAAALTEHFLLALDFGDPAQALRAAAIDLRKDPRYAAPRHRAAFAVYGPVRD